MAGAMQAPPRKEDSMNKYLLVESRDPFEASVVVQNYALAVSLARVGNDVQ
jgi:hypothetical protein